MAWPNAEGALVALAVIVPGFVFVLVRESLIPSRVRDFSKSIVEFFGYGGISFVLFARLLVPRMRDLASNLQPTNWDYLSAIFVAIIVPFVAGLASVRCGRSNFLHKLAGMGGSGRALEPTAWDYFFGSRDKPCWILVRMRDGNNVAGIFEKGCYASSYPEPESLYIRRIYYTTEDGSISSPVADSAGAIINGADIRLVEMWEMPKSKEKETNDNTNEEG